MTDGTFSSFAGLLHFACIHSHALELFMLFLPSHIMSEQLGISTGRVWIIKLYHIYHDIEYINYISQRQSEDYDDYSDGPTQDPISAQLGLVADSNRCSIFIF